MNSNTDNVSTELREIEREIDHYYQSNTLLKLPFTTAAWLLLSYAEDYMLNEQIAINSIQDVHALGSDFITELEHSMLWLYCDYEQGGVYPSDFDQNLYTASKDLFELGQKYDLVVFAYKCATDGILELELYETTIQPTQDFFNNIEYDAYNILIDPRDAEEALPLLNPPNFLMETILNSIKTDGVRFRYKLNPRIVADMILYLKPLFDRIFLLPAGWKFSRYTLEDFRKVFEAVCAIAHIHWEARQAASLLGCDNKGYLDGVYILTIDELLNRIIRYSGLSKEKVQYLLDDLTYGNSGINNPKPALQPLIRLNPKQYVIAPNIWMCSAAERNFISLIW